MWTYREIMKSQNEDMEIRMRERQGYITVIVPVYNVEKYLDRCMESILAQTYTKLEIILVDDGAADSSGAICDFYAQKDARVQVITKRMEDSPVREMRHWILHRGNISDL